MKLFLFLIPALMWGQSGTVEEISKHPPVDGIAKLAPQIPYELYIEWGALQANIRQAQDAWIAKAKAACGGDLAVDVKQIYVCAPKPEPSKPEPPAKETK